MADGSKIELGTNPGTLLPPPAAGVAAAGPSAPVQVSGPKFELGGDPAAAISAAAPVTAPTSMGGSPGDPLVGRGQLLPIGTTQSGQKVFAVPEFLAGPFQTIHDLMTGARTPDQVSGKEVFDLGMLLGGLGPATKFPTAPTIVSPIATAGQRIGVDVPRAITETAPLTKLGASITSAVPIAGEPERKAAQAALDQLDQVAQQSRNNLGTSASPQEAGTAVQTGITDYTAKNGPLSQSVGDAYKAVDALVDPGAAAALPQTAAVAQQISNARQAAGLPPSRAVNLILDAVTRPDGLTYAGVQKLRTTIGEMIDPSAILPSDTSGAELKQIYGALSGDMRTVLQQTGGKPAVDAWDAANATATQAAETRQALAKVVGQGNSSEEAIFARLNAMAGSNARADVNTLAAARQAVGDPGWNTVLSGLVNQWGFTPDGKFNPQQFLTNWNKISPEAKNVLFQSGDGKQLRGALNDIATVSQKAADLQRMATPAKVGIIKGAIGMAGAFAAYKFAINPLEALAPLAGAYGVSRLLATPETASAVAGWAKAYMGYIADPATASATLGRTAAKLGSYMAIQQGLNDVQTKDLIANLASPDQATLKLRQYEMDQEDTQQRIQQQMQVEGRT